MQIAVLGASGGVGRETVRQALARGWAVTGQSRDASRLAEFAGRIRLVACAPTDSGGLRDLVRGAGAVVIALGIDRLGPTTLFSDSTAALIAAMRDEGVGRLVAVTGVGAGETRGHGGFLYDRILFPLFTRHRYADKDRQEALIAASGLDWTIVRPAPFARSAPPGPVEAHVALAPGTVLRRVTRAEVAAFILEELETGRFRGQRPFIGHP